MGILGIPVTSKIQLPSDTSDFGEIWTIHVDLHEKYNGSDPNFIDGHVGGLWGAAPLKIEVYPIFGEI